MQIYADIAAGWPVDLAQCEINAPVFNYTPLIEHALEGYLGGELDPLLRGVGYFVVTVRGVQGVIAVDNNGSVYRFSPNPIP